MSLETKCAIINNLISQGVIKSPSPYINILGYAVLNEERLIFNYSLNHTFKNINEIRDMVNEVVKYNDTIMTLFNIFVPPIWYAVHDDDPNNIFI